MGDFTPLYAADGGRELTLLSFVREFMYASVKTTTFVSNNLCMTFMRGVQLPSVSCF